MGGALAISICDITSGSRKQRDEHHLSERLTYYGCNFGNSTNGSFDGLCHYVIDALSPRESQTGPSGQENCYASRYALFVWRNFVKLRHDSGWPNSINRHELHNWPRHGSRVEQRCHFELGFDLYFSSSIAIDV